MTIEPTPEMVAAFREAQNRRAAELVAEGAPLGGHDILERGLAAVLAIVYRPDPHLYLSTGCLHGDHGYCQVETRRYDGTTKVASSCKFCGARCVCPCHETGAP